MEKIGGRFFGCAVVHCVGACVLIVSLCEYGQRARVFFAWKSTLSPSCLGSGYITKATVLSQAYARHDVPQHPRLGDVIGFGSLGRRKMMYS